MPLQSTGNNDASAPERNLASDDPENKIRKRLSRRAVLAAVAGHAAAAQSPKAEARRNAPSDLRIGRHGDPELPAIAVSLPGSQYDPCAVIEMPEHAWRRQRKTDEQTWFYKMYGADPRLKGQVAWSSSPARISYQMKTPSGFTLSGAASLESNGVRILYEIETGAENELEELEAATCVKLYRPFTDVFLERTYIHQAGGLHLIASETPERLRKNAEEWLPCRYIASVGNSSQPSRYRVEQLEGVTRYFTSQIADSPFLATESHPSGWTAATHGNSCDSVFTNPARTCHHADPRARNITGARMRLELKVYFIRGSAGDAWNIISSRATPSV